MPSNTTATANTYSSTTKQCLFYWTHLSNTGEPLMGTMFAKNDNKYDAGNGPCTEARLPATQMVAPAGKTQCFFPSKFRYFYLVSNQGKIIPNSMIQVSGNGKPNQMCVGSNHYLEYKNFSGVRTNAIVG